MLRGSSQLMLWLKRNRLGKKDILSICTFSPFFFPGHNGRLFFMLLFVECSSASLCITSKKRSNKERLNCLQWHTFTVFFHVLLCLLHFRNYSVTSFFSLPFTHFSCISSYLCPADRRPHNDAFFFFLQWPPPFRAAKLLRS